MKKIKLAVIFGGMSTEHDVSIVSGISILKNLNKEKYQIYPIYIDRKGYWYKYNEDIEKIEIPKVGDKLNNIEYLEDVMEFLRQMDCIFPVLHGLYGEDGSIQGLFELIKVPYVGCKILSSSIAMDKAYAKVIFEKAGLNQAKYAYIKKKNDENYIYVGKDLLEKEYALDEILNIIEKQIEYPMFVKPSNSGSSVGVKKVHSKKNLKEAIILASNFDKKILIEEGIRGKEVECAVLGTDNVEASTVGEIISAEEFYSFDSKYNNSASKTIIPANIPKEKIEEIRALAVKAFKAIDGTGLARIDFFIESKTNKVIINEINTMPGFTQISMYPKLFEAVGTNYSELLDKIIALAM